MEFLFEEVEQANLVSFWEKFLWHGRRTDIVLKRRLQNTYVHALEFFHRFVELFILAY